MYEAAKDEFGFFRKDLDDLIELLHPESDLIAGLKDEIEELKKENNKLQGDLAKQIEENKIIQSEPPKGWRSAFSYKSEWLYAMFDMIEKYYIDDEGKQIDVKDLPGKKEIESDVLTVLMRDEADKIITSGQRKGKNTKK